MRKRLIFLGLSALSLLGTGCAGVKGPDWYHPGSAEAQQRYAAQYDPYPEDIGPEMPGVRPRGFDKPPLVPAQVQRFPQSWWGR